MLTALCLAAALHADGAAPDRADKMRLYGWLVGRWQFEVTAYEENGTTHRNWRGEVSRDGGRTWHLQVDISAERITQPASN